MAEGTGCSAWNDKQFIDDWATKGSWQASIRDVQPAMVLRMIRSPLTRRFERWMSARDSALGGAVLRDRPNATAAWRDASEAMLKLGLEKNTDLKDRMTFVLGSLESPLWLKSVTKISMR